ncbi:hypothetical protein PENSPDRAFT_448134 [Peniophora sp. CONT]|nr:hypothetical protein PENSPDRAFT_448134 [Peniophora sp. CONT]
MKASILNPKATPTTTPTKTTPMPTRTTDANIGDVPPRPTIPTSTGALRRFHQARKRADTVADPKDITLSQTKPTVKRANTLDRLRPRAWTKGATVVAPAPLALPDNAEEIEISVSRQLFDRDDENEEANLSTGTFHGMLNPKPRKRGFGNLGKNKPPARPPLSVRVSIESRISFTETFVSSGESSEATTCVNSAAPSPIPFSSRTTTPPKPVPTSSIPALPSLSTEPSPVLATIPKEMHRDAPQAHSVIVQPSPIRFEAAQVLERGENWESLTPPSRPSSAPSLFSSVEPESDPVEEAYWEKQAAQLKNQPHDQWQRQYDDMQRLLVDHRLCSGQDIDYVSYRYMTDEQKAQVDDGPWIWQGVEYHTGRKEGKWVVDKKKWAKLAKKVKKEEKAQGMAIKL